MKRATFLLSLCLACAVPFTAFSQTSGQMVDWQPYVQVVTDYVRQSRQWDDGQYTVKFNDWNEDGTLLFSVAWKWPPSRVPYPGSDGRSFYAIVDPQTGKVVREARGQ